MKNFTNPNVDILKELDIKQEIERLQSEQIKEETSKNPIKENIEELKKLNIKEEIQRLELEKNQRILNENTPEKVIQEGIVLEERKEKRINKRKQTQLVSSIIFLTKYIITSAFIFAVLLVTTNYSAYINIAKSYIYAGDLEMAEQRLVTSVEASNIKEKYKIEAEEKKKELENENNSDELEALEDKEESRLSIKNLEKAENKKDINLNIEITPYSNRVIIPKIGKNIPLIDIKNRSISGENELNDIFMKELENGIIRYPGSSKPGEEGTSFIFGHSSNYPWIKGDYNDVFSLLDNVSYSDDIIVYYGQKKFTYKVKEKKVITPGDVSVLERNKKKSEITLMTCWPVGTTLNRLIVVGELIDENGNVIENIE